MGRWEEAYEHMKKAVARLPRLEGAHNDFSWLSEYLRKYEEAERHCLIWMDLRPDNIYPYYRLANIYLRWQGDTKKARNMVERSRGKVDSSLWDEFMIRLDIFDGDIESAHKKSLEQDDYENIAWTYALMGFADSARVYFDSSLTQFIPRFKKNINHAHYQSIMGYCFARMSNFDSAYVYARRATNMWTIETHPSRAIEPIEYLLDIHNYAGLYDSALATLEFLLNIPAKVDLGTFLLDPDYSDLRKEPGFARLVEEYGNEYHKRLFEQSVGSL
jgi:tetratricopeptide (TPR) repeat protein